MELELVACLNNSDNTLEIIPVNSNFPLAIVVSDDLIITLLLS